jgi:hypothetical protein
MNRCADGDCHCELVVLMWAGCVELVMAVCLAVRLGEGLNEGKLRLLLLA